MSHLREFPTHINHQIEDTPPEQFALEITVRHDPLSSDQYTEYYTIKSYVVADTVVAFTELDGAVHVLPWTMCAGFVARPLAPVADDTLNGD